MNAAAVKSEHHKSRFADLGLFKSVVVEAIAAFFIPWSLLYFLAFWGWRSTKDLIAAMIRDWIWTVALCVAGFVVVFAYLFSLVSDFLVWIIR